MNSYVCKIVILESKDQRILKPRKLDEKENLSRFVRANSIKKCLFGVPDPDDTQQMLEEQQEIDRQRFSERFGFDIEDIENLESDGQRNGNVSYGQNRGQSQQVSRKCLSGRRILKGQRRVFKPHNGQAVITDFYQARKNVQSTEKLSKQSKEN